MLDPTSAPIQDLREEIREQLDSAEPPISYRELARALQIIDGRVRSRTYLGHVLQGREDGAPHVRGYLGRCQQALRLVGEQRREAAEAIASA